MLREHLDGRRLYPRRWTFGADRAVLLIDRRFAGSDTLVITYALAAAIRKVRKEHGPPTSSLPASKPSTVTPPRWDPDCEAAWDATADLRRKDQSTRPNRAHNPNGTTCRRRCPGSAYQPVSHYDSRGHHQIRRGAMAGCATSRPRANGEMERTGRWSRGPFQMWSRRP